MPLEKIQQSLSWLGILTNTSKRDKLFRSVVVIAVEICMLAASATFLLKNASIDLEASLNAVLQLSATGSLTYMLLSAFTMHKKIHAIIIISCSVSIQLQWLHFLLWLVGLCMAFLIRNICIIRVC